ncbi:MAG: hypothetical protein EBT30_06030 [Verrucomicrobia bacterium]|nr:hypothetical protein [Verrucomicrobiota bacterium]
MESVRTFPILRGVFLALLVLAGGGWAQTIGTVPAQNYTAGVSNPAIALTLSGFQANRTLRTMAANTTSGTGQKYEGPGTRIFQGLLPDIVMIQEFNVGGNSQSEIRSWLDTTFGTNFSYFRESSGSIPNGVISRWPILRSGSWDDGDDAVSDRGFAWAQIDIPGPRNLWVISFHLKASSGSSNSSRRNAQAQTLVGLIQANVPTDDYLLIGGDANTYSYSEACLDTLSALVDVSAPRPVDQGGDADTNAGRSSPYDWVMAEPELDALEVPVTIGSLSFATGLVFDSRVFSDLSLVSPVQSGDSGVTGMQHMAVVRSFRVDAPEVVTVQVQSSNTTLLPAGNVEVLGSGLSRSLRITPAAGQTGSANVTVTVSDGLATDTETFKVTVAAAQTPFQSWGSAYGLSGTSAEAGADPDGDGLVNLAEYALGGNPTNAAGGLGPTVSTTNTNGTNWLRFAYRARTNDGGLVIQPEFKVSLTETNWSTNGVVQKVSGKPPSPRLWRLQASHITFNSR